MFTPSLKNGIGKTITFNHKDGNKLNNNKDNIEKISLKDNIKHGFLNGLYPCCQKVVYEGIEYYSKAELRRVKKISEKKLEKMIEEKKVEVIK